MQKSGIRVCPVCGKEFDISFYTNYAYKKVFNGKQTLYCGYNCMRVIERKEEEMLYKDDNK